MTTTLTTVYIHTLRHHFWWEIVKFFQHQAASVSLQCFLITPLLSVSIIFHTIIEKKKILYVIGFIILLLPFYEMHQIQFLRYFFSIKGLNNFNTELAGSPQGKIFYVFLLDLSRFYFYYT